LPFVFVFILEVVLVIVRVSWPRKRVPPWRSAKIICVYAKASQWPDRRTGAPFVLEKIAREHRSKPTPST